MKSGVLEQVQQPVVITESKEPVVGDRDVLVRVHACGICRTDIHIADGWMAQWFGLDPFPIIPGHEITGVVESVGPAVTQYQPGDRVAVFYLITCGRCRNCLSGLEQTCETLFTGFDARGFTSDGGYAEYIAMPEQFIVPLPDQLDFQTAAPLVCGGLTAYGGLKRAGLQAGQRAAIIGIGGIGHVAIQLANAMGAEVVAITSEPKVELARQLGAHHVITRGGDLGAQLKAIGGGADVIISTTVDASDLGQMVYGLAPRGSLVVIGLTPPGETAIAIEPGAILFGAQRIMGNLMGSRQDLRDLLNLAVMAGITPMIETYSLDDVNRAHDRMRTNDVRFRAVLDLAAG